MDAQEEVPVSQQAPSLRTSAPTDSSAPDNDPRDRSLMLRMAARPYRWFQKNTFAPNFLSGAWAHPALGYLVALVFQLLVSFAILGLVHVYPSFRFPAVPLILVILLVALGWGAGPAIVALLIGAMFLLFFVLPPTFSPSIQQTEDVVGLILYLAVGLTISIFASNIERARRTSEELRLRLNAIIDTIPDSLTIYDAEGRRVLQNRVVSEVERGENPPLTLSQMPGQLATRRSCGELLPLELLPVARALRGEVVVGAEVLYHRPGQEQDRLVAISAAPLYDPSGITIEGAVAIIHVTETYEVNRRKDEFISMASHELKTPVTSLKGFAQVLQRRLHQQGDEQAQHFVARMDAQINRLTKLISDLLDVSKMQAGKLTFAIEPLELDTLVLETVENVQAASPDHRILIEGRTGARIMGDKDRLGQVFVNLFTNAVKYSPKAEKVMVHLSANSREALVCVQDFGIGIDGAHHQRIFERFYQVNDPEERTFPGLGMGLYISHEIVQRHQGRMWVESKKGEGSIFSVALPLVQQSS